MKMSFIRKQTSRLNSLDDNLCKCLPKSSYKCPVHIEFQQNEDETVPSEGPESQETECESLKIDLKMSEARTSSLIQDYLEFKAARSIQRFVRGWLYRCQYRRKRWAAVVIQTEWRRFYGQRLDFRKLEAELQQRIEQHFFRAAQTIQAFWRGWWVRRHVHDLTHLKRVQLVAGEDLLYCVAFKLHHLLRTHQIPGVYSLRNSNAFSKVEQLLASLRFKAFNQRTQQAMQQRCRERRSAEKQHIKSAFGTQLPFPKNYVNSSIKEKCSILYNAKDADARMAKIIRTYVEGNRQIFLTQTLKRTKSAAFKPSASNNSPPKTSSFCGDIVNSMKKWKIITAKNLNVDSSIFKKPENVENFLTEITSKLSLVEQNRRCGSEFLKPHFKTEAEYSKNKTRPCAGTRLFPDQVETSAQTSPGGSITSSVVFNLDSTTGND